MKTIAPMNRYGRWTVICYSHKRGGRVHLWNCRCDCGTERAVISQSLRDGTSKSCGCLKIEKTSKRTKTHGLSKTPLYGVWKTMVGRCRNKNHTEFHRYGGRGISVCRRWLRFENFLADMGHRPTSWHSIERRNNNGNYCKQNCFWSDQIQQANNRRNNHVIEFRGESLTLVQWSRKFGIDYSTLRNRIRYGWPIDERLFSPAKVIRRSGVNRCDS